MYIAYVKSSFESIDGIKVTDSKTKFTNKIAVFEKSITKENAYVLNEQGGLLFHESWLTGVTEIKDGIIMVKLLIPNHNPESSSIKFIYRIAEKKKEKTPLICYRDQHTNLMYYSPIAINIRDAGVEDGHILKDIETNEKIVSNIYNIFPSTYLLEFSSSFGEAKLTYSCEDIICNECIKPYKFYTITNEVNLCSECYITTTVKCDKCSTRFIPTNDNKILIKGNLKAHTFCYSCLDEYEQCNVCKIYVAKNRIYTIDHEKFCNDCVLIVGKDKPVHHCCVCSTMSFTPMTLTRNIGEEICDVCYLSRRIGEDRPIKEYSYKPYPIFFGNKKEDSLFFGIELEITTPRNRNQLSRYIQFNINTKDEFIYNKFDRSIGADGMAGFEIVTHPFNTKWLKDEGINIFDKIFGLKRFGCESFKTNTCGMHIHMSKDSFTSTHLYKFLKMIYENKKFAILISERVDIDKVNKYSNFTPVASLKKLADDRTHNNDTFSRHKAINLSNEHTIEVRIFRGTLEPERFFKNIEYCKSLYDFTKDCAIEELTIEKYKKFIATNNEEYSNLFTFLKSKGEI